MTKKIRVEGDGRLLFELDTAGAVEILHRGRLYRVDIVETLRTGVPVVSKAFIGKRPEVLTRIDTCDNMVAMN